MTPITATRMVERPAKYRGHDYQPQPNMSPAALHIEFPDAAQSHGKLSPAPVVDVSPKSEIYEHRGRPRELFAELRFGRQGDFDYMLGSMSISNLENEKALLPINISPYNSSDDLHDQPPKPREGLSLVQHSLVESQPPTKFVSPDLPGLPRRHSMSHSSSSYASLPPPRPPPGPAPAPGSFTGARLPHQLDYGEASKDGRPRPPSVQAREPDETSSTGRLFPMQNAPSLQPSPQSRQAHRKRSGDEIMEKIRAIRAEVWGLRSNIFEKRTVLREKENAKSIADDELIKYLRTTGLGRLSRKNRMDVQDILKRLFEECETLRNEYGPLEDDYNLLENVLNNREYEMQKLEAALEKRWTEAPLSEQENTSFEHSPPPSSYSGSEFSQDLHPLVAEYLSKVGDVEIFRERLDWHADERLSLEQQKETLERVDMRLAEADQTWLNNYSETEAALTKQLEDAEAEAERLRIQCFSRGLIDEYGEPLDFEDQERQTFTDELDPGSERSDFVKFPRLLHNPGSKNDLLPDPPLPSDDTKEEDLFRKTQDPSDRINSWLLRTLRSSPLDVNLLSRTFQHTVGLIPEGEEWQIEVLAFWYRDGSKEMAAKYQRSLSEVVTHSRQKTGEQHASLSERRFGVMLISSSRLPLPNSEKETTV
jgi:hypothetical protein